MANPDNPGRAVLVTGASRGIGAALAAGFARSGDRVAVHYGAREEQALEVQASLPGDGHIVAGADLLDAGAVRRMVDDVAEAFGGIDVLVNNAGVFEPHPITDTSYYEWQESWRRTLGRQPDRRRERDVVRRSAHGRRRTDRQRLLARRVSRRARSARVRREQGRPDRVRSVAGARTRATRDLRHRGGARVHGDRHGRLRTRGRAGSPPPRREPARARRDGRRGRRRRRSTSPRPEPRLPAARSSTSTGRRI